MAPNDVIAVNSGFWSNDGEATDSRRKILDDKQKGRKNGARKGPNTETICADIPHIAVKLYIINGDKFRIMSMFL